MFLNFLLVNKEKAQPTQEGIYFVVFLPHGEQNNKYKLINILILIINKYELTVRWNACLYNLHLGGQCFFNISSKSSKNKISNKTL